MGDRPHEDAPNRTELTAERYAFHHEVDVGMQLDRETSEFNPLEESIPSNPMDPPILPIIHIHAHCMCFYYPSL